MLCHNSQLTLYREPFGACRTEVSVTLRLFSSEKAVAVCVISGEDFPMELCEEKDGGYLYEYTFSAPSSPTLLFYYFRIENECSVRFYGNNTLMMGGMGEVYDHIPESKFQITVYDKNFTTPDRMKNSVMYQIFPDRFYRGKDTPIHGIRREWGDEPFYRKEQFGAEYLSNDFFGGNFDGILKKLPYLKELGITTVYLNPISKSFSNHRYDTGDYDIPDETLGTTEDFSILCAEAEKQGISIILDGVYSHTGADSKYFNKYGNYDSIGAYQSEASPYFSWYNFENYPEKYDSWWGFETLPNVNELDKAYTDYIIDNPDSVINKWLDRGAMGLRLDVADELPDEFISKLRTALKKKNPEALLIGEVWEDASNKVSYGKRREFLLGRELDSVMNYVFREALLSYLLDCDSLSFSKKLMSLIENYPSEALYTAMNLISSHDVPRALTVLSGAPDFRTLTREQQHDYVIPPIPLHIAERRMVLAICMQMTLPGIPTIYYGDERGMTGFADPFNRCCVDWENKNEILFEQTKLLSDFRNKNACLRTGFYKTIYAQDGVLAYIRYGENGKDAFGKPCTDGSILIIINPVDSYKDLSLSPGSCTGKIKDALSGEIISENSQLNLCLEPFSYRLLTF